MRGMLIDCRLNTLLVSIRSVNSRNRLVQKKVWVKWLKDMLEKSTCQRKLIRTIRLSVSIPP